MTFCVIASDIGDGQGTLGLPGLAVARRHVAVARRARKSDSPIFSDAVRACWLINRCFLGVRSCPVALKERGERARRVAQRSEQRRRREAPP